MDKKQYIPVAYKTGITTGTTVTSGATTANAAIPVDASGNNPKRCMFVSTASVHVKLCTTSGGAATANDLMITTTPVVLDTVGVGFFAYIQEAAASKLTVTPCEQ